MTQSKSGEELPLAVKHRILAACMISIFLAALDQMIVAPVLPAMAQEFGNWADISWVITAYLLVATAVIPIYGRASDIFGRRRMLSIAIGTFCLGSVLCALAPSLSALAFARGVQALGGGGLIALAMTIIGDIFAPRERGRYQGYISAIYASAAILGPILGGILGDLAHWSIIFWINLPFGVLAYAVAHGALRHLAAPVRRQYLDLPGAALFVAGTSAVVFAMSSAGIRWPWLSAEMLVLLGAAAVFWLLFAYRLSRVPEALIARHVVTDKVVIRATLAAFFAVGSSTGLASYLPSYFQVALGYSSAQAGAALVPLLLAVAAGATFSGRSLLYLQRYKTVPLVGLAAAMSACAILAIWLPVMPPAGLAILLAVVGAGVGSMMPVSLIVVQNAVQRSDLGAATAVTNVARQLGSVIIVAAFGAVLLDVDPAAWMVGHGVAATAGESPIISAEGFASVLWLAAANFLVAFGVFASIEARPLRGRNS